MASYLFINTVHVCFESVLAMDNAGMVAMFESLVDTGLKGFLGCPAVIHEADLLEFFANGSVRDGVVVSTVNGVTVEISEQLFAETFELPVEGLTDLSEIHKDLVFDARSIVSLSGESVSMFGKNKELAIEFRLICEILAKTISVKAGSFDAITQEKFLMMATITCGVRINWNRLLFNIFKDMVTPGSRKAKGNAIQISLLLENFPNLELGESSEFPYSKVLTEKTVHRYIVLNDKVGMEVVTAEPRVKKTPTKKAASKKRPATDAAVAPVVKNKRTTKSKSVSLKDTLDIFPVSQDEPVVESGTISIPGVNEGDWYKASLPKISAADKGKAPLLERDPAKGNPIKEQFSLFLADIEVLVMLREQIIDEVEKFFDSFSLKRLATLKIDESYFDKEALILSWAETESTRVSLNMRTYILTKYREFDQKIFGGEENQFYPRRSWVKATTSCKTWVSLKTTQTGKTTKPQRNMGSNPSTESNYKTTLNNKNKIQMLCMQLGTTAEGYNQGREPKNSMHSSTEIFNRICGHASHSAHKGNESAESPLVLASWQQLRDLALANNSLQEWYRKEEPLKWSPTLPQMPKTMVGNNGNSPKKLTVNSTRVRETEVDNLENFTKHGIGRCIKTLRSNLIKRRRITTSSNPVDNPRAIPVASYREPDASYRKPDASYREPERKLQETRRKLQYSCLSLTSALSWKPVDTYANKSSQLVPATSKRRRANLSKRCRFPSTNKIKQQLDTNTLPAFINTTHPDFTKTTAFKSRTTKTRYDWISPKRPALTTKPAFTQNLKNTKTSRNALNVKSDPKCQPNSQTEI
ncbi:patatin-like protein 2 [Dorcoceras hygrometricum]|uniref:Patatin-like protein 2 n=1 Tax=Dorcoceras hygrometricum TaxID=472368 RepID=A0A2Z7AH24_9LAMI|nr:patatin-like protein 2 [Dorcoceras hygrometricum]